MNERYLYANISYGTRLHKSFYPLYGVFNETEGKVLGYTEHSFNMKWSKDFVRLWGYKTAKYYLDKFIEEQPNKGKFFIVRLSKRNGRIVADFKRRKELYYAGHQKKYYFRNCPFTINAGDSAG